MQNLDKRYKYSVRYTHPFYLYIKYKRSGIFYVRFKDGSTYSTRTTNLQEAHQTALKMLQGKDTKKAVNPQDIKTVLCQYYKPGSDWIKYDIIHGSKYSERVLKQNDFACQKMAELLKGTADFTQLTKARLHKLQEQLLQSGLSGKSVNNYIAILHKIVKQLIDKEILQNDPFIGLRNCAHEKQRRLCFPVDLFRGFFGSIDAMDGYELVAYCAIATGARRTELMNLALNDLQANGNIYTLRIRGTKSEYSDRTIPLSEYSANAVKKMIENNAATPYTMRYCAEEIGTKIGYSPEKIKAEGICFHSFRKMYKTILTGANLSTTLVETFMGHSTDNQGSNNVERIYFVADRADMAGVYKKVVDSFEFLYYI